MEIDTDADNFDTGRVRKPRPGSRPAPRPAGRPAPRPANGRRLGLGRAAAIQVTEGSEDRAGLMLGSADTAGNAPISAFHGQTTSQHEFICTAVKVSVVVANDPALAADPTTFAQFSSAPTIKGKPIMDGRLIVKGNGSQVIPLAKAATIREQTGLSLGNATLTGGNAQMKWSIHIHYMTELDQALNK